MQMIETISKACYYIGLLASEGILLTRTVAVWDNNKRVFRSLAVLLLLVAGFSVFLGEKFIALNKEGSTSGLLECKSTNYGDPNS
jgi:hypothetical protein